MRRLVAALLLSLAPWLASCRPRPAAAPQASPPSQARLRLAPAEPVGFARATAPREIRLPLDHGPHFEFQTEWWYYTGQLAAPDGRRFGFQLTFFRRGLSPGPPPAAGLATNQVYFAHFAITDLAGNRHAFAERVSRGAAGLAGASGAPFSVFVEEWSARGAAGDGSSVHLSARDQGLLLELELRATKPLALHGDRGLSAKSSEPGNASFYVGYTRMAARGRIGADGQGEEATGEAWFDHEWSTSALGAGAVGWDWWSLQLDDGRELMFFVIRRQDGGRDPASSGTLVAVDGRTTRLAAADVEAVATGGWTSPRSGATYPARWRLRVPNEELQLEVEPLVADQELRTSFTYWEGAVRVSGTAHARPVSGRGYVELTGYARSMQGMF